MDKDRKISKKMIFGAFALIVTALVICAFIFWPKNASSDTPSNSETMDNGLIEISDAQNVDRRGDIIFIHGLGGNGHDTWLSAETKFYWPKEIAKRYPDLGVWVFNYESSVSNWVGYTMSIENRSINLLNRMKIEKLGQRPIIFITHSLGGILAKQMLEDTTDFNRDQWSDIGLNTKGVVFLGTPHTGSGVTDYLKYLNTLARTNITHQQLENNAPVLMRLNDWYREHYEEMEISTLPFFETHPTYAGVIVVDQTSGNPGITNAKAIPVEENHISICKPKTTRSEVYKSVDLFIQDKLLATPKRYEITFKDFRVMFNEIKNDSEKINEFIKLHQDQQIEWDVVVRKISDDKKYPTYSLSYDSTSPRGEWVVAGFKPWNFNKDIPIGTQLKITGIISNKSNSLGVILKECKIVKQ